MVRSRTDDLELARRYLLRQLDGREQAQADERVFLDPTFFEQVEIAEDDLIEEDAGGDVPDVDRASVLEFMNDPTGSSAPASLASCSSASVLQPSSLRRRSRRRRPRASRPGGRSRR